MKRFLVGLTVVFASASGKAQSTQLSASPLGSVSSADAVVRGVAAALVPASQGRAAVIGGTVVTANPGHNADLALTRGGSVLICQTSSLHVAGSIPGPLLLALDRGAMEIRMKSVGDDSVMTPDLRFTMPGGGMLDLHLRVSFNGDTCVENRGRRAPTLHLTDAFGDSSYEVQPGQHVLFEHGSLREVVDRETTPCGCPPPQSAGVSIAEAALLGGGAQSRVSPQQAEATHPFPAAVSEGLAAPAPLPPETPTGGAHVQVATALTYDPADPLAAALAAADPITGNPAPAPKPQVAPIRAFFRRVKRFFTGG